MGVLDTQTVRRKQGNRRVRSRHEGTPRSARPRFKLPFFDDPRISLSRAKAPPKEASPEVTRRRDRERTQESRRGVAGAAALWRAAAWTARTMWRGMEALGSLALAALALGAKLVVAAANLTWRGLSAGARITGRGALGLGKMSRRGVVAAKPHVKRGMERSVELSKQGAEASVRAGRKVADESKVRLRNQAEYMKDGFPDLDQGVAEARKAGSRVRRSTTSLWQRFLQSPAMGRPTWRQAGRAVLSGMVIGLTGAAVAAGALFGPPAVESSEALMVTEIAVAGNHRVGSEDILRAAGIEEGDNLVRIDLARVADGVRALPWVKSVSLRRRYPDRFVITVAERQPMLMLADGDLSFVDEDGEVFKAVERGEWMDLPVVTGLTMDDRVADPEACRARLRQAISVVQAFSETESVPAEDIGELHLAESGDFVVRTVGEGVALKLDGSEYALGLRRLDTLLERDLLSLAAVSGIDLALRNQVVVVRKAEL